MKIHDKIFVYGTLKQGFHANHFLAGRAEFIDEDRVEGSLYNLGAFPGFKVEGSNTVKGEVYEITDETLPAMLDAYEGYPALYDRVKIRTEKGYLAWVYVIADQQTVGCELILEGVWG